MEPIHTIDDLALRVQELGFLPLFPCGVRGFSVYENTPCFWSDDEDGPWEWKGPMIRSGNCAYGKFFNRKAGFVSLDWLPDFLNHRRTLHLAPNDDAAAMDDIVLQTVQTEQRVTVKEIRQLLGLGGRRRPGDLVVEAPMEGRVNIDTHLTRLMMEGRVCIADFVYNIDRHGNRYGWGVAKYTIPEHLYGRPLCDCTPQQSYEKMLAHLRTLLPTASEVALRKLL